MEYRITTSEIPPQCQDTEEYVGLLVHIRPPVQLNSDAVERYLIHKDFEPIDRADPIGMRDVEHVTVLGSTPEQTTIYASIHNYQRYQNDPSYPDVSHLKQEITNQVTRDVAKILAFMGAQALVE